MGRRREMIAYESGPLSPNLDPLNRAIQVICAALSGDRLRGTLVETDREWIACS